MVRLKSDAVLSYFMQIIVRLSHEKNVFDIALGIEKNILKLA